MDLHYVAALRAVMCTSAYLFADKRRDVDIAISSVLLHKHQLFFDCLVCRVVASATRDLGFHCRVRQSTYLLLGFFRIFENFSVWNCAKYMAIDSPPVMGIITQMFIDLKCLFTDPMLLIDYWRKKPTITYAGKKPNMRNSSGLFEFRVLKQTHRCVATQCSSLRATLLGPLFNGTSPPLTPIPLQLLFTTILEAHIQEQRDNHRVVCRGTLFMNMSL
uniref:SFRICE_010417 n=1 Tax=Spodoptera frugiperda TaxID=7108 RepID=A0A2H1WJ76_SPOFR